MFVTLFSSTFGRKWVGRACALSRTRSGKSSKLHSAYINSYTHTKSIRLWKTFCEDEGCRAVCSYLGQAKGVTVLELLDNKITALGCEFIGKLIHPRSLSNIQILKLDHNEIGGKGVTALGEGLAVNKSMVSLSLTYCNIDASGARALFEVLIYTQSKLLR